MIGGYKESIRLNDMKVIGDFNKNCFQGRFKTEIKTGGFVEELGAED